MSRIVFAFSACVTGAFSFWCWNFLTTDNDLDGLNGGLTALFLFPVAVISTCVFVAFLVGTIKPEWFAEPPKKSDVREYENVRYVSGESGSLWKGPCSPDSNLHWAKFGGITDSGESIWTLRRSDPPSTDWLSPEQVEEAIVAVIALQRRSTAGNILISLTADQVSWLDGHLQAEHKRRGHRLPKEDESTLVGVGAAVQHATRLRVD